MDRKAEEASEVQRKSVVILSDRSREIIRLFEERERKRPSGFGFFGSHAISTNSFKAEIDAEPEAPPLLKLTGYFKNQEGCRHTRNESAVFKFSYFTRKKTLATISATCGPSAAQPKRRYSITSSALNMR